MVRCFSAGYIRQAPKQIDQKTRLNRKRKEQTLIPKTKVKSSRPIKQPRKDY